MQKNPKTIVELDHYLSQYLLKMDNPLVSYFLLPFSSLFHPKMILIPILTIYYISSFSILDAAYYALSMLITVILSTLLKRNFKRERPLLREKVKKFQHFRKKQRNFSIPSGDTVQAVLFSYFLYEVYGINWILSFSITLLVAISRVYFMCHWIGDTIVAMLVQAPISMILVHFRTPTIEFAKALLLKF